MYKRVPVSLVTGCLAFVSVVFVAGQTAPPPQPAAGTQPRAQAPQAASTAPQRPVAIARTASAAEVASQRAVLDQYCVVCHNEKLKTANLLLDKLDLARLGGSRGDRRESRAETARRDDAAVGHAAAGSGDARGADHAGWRTSSTASAATAPAPAGPSPSQSRRVHERDSRPARAGSRRHEVPAVRRFDPRVRQHRRRADGCRRR